jgi:hypothetical protein
MLARSRQIVNDFSTGTYVYVLTTDARLVSMNGMTTQDTKRERTQNIEHLSKKLEAGNNRQWMMDAFNRIVPLL